MNTANKTARQEKLLHYASLSPYPRTPEIVKCRQSGYCCYFYITNIRYILNIHPIGETVA
jgi:hypothetical protein